MGYGGINQAGVRSFNYRVAIATPTRSAMFKSAVLNEKLRKAQKSFYKEHSKKQRLSMASLRSRKRPKKFNNGWEKNYFIAWNFKRRFFDSPKEEKIIELIRLSKKKVDNKISYEKRRQNKHKVFKDCWVCRERKAYYTHHIILITNGGYDNGVNRIPICKFCHAEIHEWIDIKRLEEEFDNEREIYILSENT